MDEIQLHELTSKIEQLVHEHIERSHQAVVSAVQRAFLQSSTNQPVSTIAGTNRAPTRPRRERPSSDPKKRRTKAELNALCDELYAAIESLPGKTMNALAAHMGTTAVALYRPMTLLKESERVRSVGARSKTRYFPIPSANCTTQLTPPVAAA